METQGKKFFYILMVASIILLFLFLKVYLAVIIFSVLLAVVFRPFYAKTLIFLKNRQGLALSATFGAIIVSFVLPLTFVGIIISYSIKDIANTDVINGFPSAISFDSVINKFTDIIQNLGLNYNITADTVTQRLNNTFTSAGKLIFGNISNIASSIFGLIPLLFIIFYVIGAVLVNYQKISVYLHDLSPLDDKVDRLYLERIKSMTLSMVKGTFVVAFVQGLITGIFLFIAGVPYALLLTLLAIFASIIPLGAGVITVPVGIILLMTGHIWQGTLILLVQIFITSNIDNILRPKLVDKKASLHPALVLIGLFAGLANFGFMGLIYGPVIMLFLATTVEVYKKYYR